MIRAFQWDLARQVERLDFLVALLPRYAAWGYQELYLHLEDAVHYPSLPGVGREDAYRYEELGELVLKAAQNGIRVVPIVNLLGHTQYLIKHPELRELNELRDEHGDPLVSGQICPLHPRLPEVAEKLLRDMAPFCTAGKVHVGLDESFHLGKCVRCREELARLGLGGHFANHVHRLHRLAGAHQLELGIWADMLYFVPEAIPLLPRGITAYDWYYYPFSRKPRVEFFNFAERDLHPALRRQGIAYYGCPMNGAFRYEPLPVYGDRLANIRSWWQRCHAVEAKGMLVTSWEAYRLALETTTVVDAAAANLWLAPQHDDATTMLARGLERYFGGKESRPQARALLAADTHAFAGYARWQINERWDVFAGNESLKPFEEDLRFFERLAARPDSWPTALARSLEFRLYLARRDLFVREAAHAVLRGRRLLARGKIVEARALVDELRSAADTFGRHLRAGRAAARAMWRRTRDPMRRGQNESILEADAMRLRDWRKWLGRARRDPSLLRETTPVCGAWQAQFVVHNFAPAVTKVLLEEQQSDGTWRETAGRYTIEFRAGAARPRAKIRREFTSPVSGPNAKLRLRVRGVGQVGISHVQVTNGVVTHRERNFRTVRRLGCPALSKGWPDPTALSDPVGLVTRS